MSTTNPFRGGLLPHPDVASAK